MFAGTYSVNPEKYYFKLDLNETRQRFAPIAGRSNDLQQLLIEAAIEGIDESVQHLVSVLSVNPSCAVDTLVRALANDVLKAIQIPAGDVTSTRNSSRWKILGVCIHYEHLYSSQNGATPLHMAAHRRRESTVQLLLELGANPNARNVVRHTCSRPT